MRTPTNGSSPNPPINYPLHNRIWPSNTLNFAPRSPFPPLQTSQNYSYILPENYLPPSPILLNLNHFAGKAFPYTAFYLNHNLKGKNVKTPNKNQRQKKVEGSTNCIIISDDQDNPQPANTEDSLLLNKQQNLPIKTDSNLNSLLNNRKSIINLENKNTLFTSNPKIDPIVQKSEQKAAIQKNQAPKRNKPIKKQREVQKAAYSLNQCEEITIPSQRSQRIRKIVNEKYRLSRKDRQMLEISYLRDYVTDIMTGPNFQAYLPVFKNNFDETQEWKRQLRNNILSRKIQQQFNMES